MKTVVVGMCQRSIRGLVVLPLVDYDRKDPALRVLDDLKEFFVEQRFTLGVPQGPETPSTVDDILSVQDRRFVWIILKMAPLKILKARRKGLILVPQEPNTYEAKVSLPDIHGMAAGVVPGFINVKAVRHVGFGYTIVAEGGGIGPHAQQSIAVYRTASGTTRSPSEN
jgi:hypothetical protein